MAKIKKIAESFGIIPLKREGNQWKVFIIKHKAGHWGMPKGHKNKNETPQETAERELKEETGLCIENYLPLGPLTMQYHCVSHGKSVNKIVTFFAANVRGEVNLCPIEIEEGEWIEIEKIKEKIAFLQIAQLMEQLQGLLHTNV